LENFIQSKELQNLKDFSSLCRLMSRYFPLRYSSSQQLQSKSFHETFDHETSIQSHESHTNSA
jgi:hypothetical protein